MIEFHQDRWRFLYARTSIASVGDVHWTLPSMRFGVTSDSVDDDGDAAGWVARVCLELFFRDLVLVISIYDVSLHVLITQFNGHLPSSEF